MTALRACPFCGDKAELYTGPAAMGEFYAIYSCEQCCAEAPRFYAKHQEEATSHAADAWNGRPEEDRLRARVKRLEMLIERARVFLEDELGDLCDECINDPCSDIKPRRQSVLAAIDAALDSSHE